MREHVVRSGEHALGIIRSYGFRHLDTVWQIPENAELRSLRSDPNVLAPGDTLRIPNREEREVPVPTGDVHRFVVNTSPLWLRLRILDDGFGACDGHHLALHGGIAEAEGTASDAAMSIRIAANEARATATLQTADTQALVVALDLDIGHLDPVDTREGALGRLYNLGFLMMLPAEATEDELSLALEDFQAEHSLSLTGELDEATRAKLLAEHGC